MQIAIVDDSEDDILVLRQFLRQYSEARLVSSTIHDYRSGVDFLEHFSEHVYDICFLDICMDTLDGLSVAERIRDVDKDCLIIFITSSPEYAVSSYRVRAFDYLLKPLNDEALSRTMDLCMQSLRHEVASIVIKCGWNVQRIAVSDIVYTDYSNHFIYFYLKNSTESDLRTSSSFADFAPSLLVYPQFLNCYRNTLINMDEVIRINPDSFTMSTGVTIPMWRKCRQELRQKYADYLFQKMNGGCRK